MADHPHQLHAVLFTEADQARLAGFSCGNEPWSRHVAQWLLGSDVFDSIARGTRVWLFETAAGEVVGFGSVGPCRWNWPPPRGSRTDLVMIPMLGLAERFRGEPPDPDWRYSRQIMGHLIAEAQAFARAAEDTAARPQWLVLLVHQDNARAIRFYEQWGFELVPGVVRGHNKDHVVMKLWIGE